MMRNIVTIKELKGNHTAETKTKISLKDALKQTNFNLYSREDFCNRVIPYNRRDFYKISLIIGTGKLYYADKSIDINHNALLFSSPIIPYSWEAVSEKQEGYFFLF